MVNVQCSMNDLLGGYCSGVPPLPIPNREVKPTCADGTAMQCGRVGSRRLFKEEPRRYNIFGAFSFIYMYAVDRQNQTNQDYPGDSGHHHRYHLTIRISSLS